MLGCFRKSCKTKSASPRSRSARAAKSPRKPVGYTKYFGTPYYQNGNTLVTGNGKTVAYLSHPHNKNLSGYYTFAQAKEQMKVGPKWNY
jgi:hypothetical protein